MRTSGVYLTAVALCCLHAASGPPAPPAPPPRSDADSDGLALSREIFRNITKQLRQSIGAKEPAQVAGASEKLEHLLQNKIEEHRYHGPHGGLHHHEHHWGPYFEGESGGGAGAGGPAGAERPLQLSGHVGSEALLSCRVGMLKDKTVMWLRRTADAVQLLTVGAEAHAGDPRVAVKFQYPNNWRLSIAPVMWLRRTADAVQLLTVGAEAHAGDPRVAVKFQYPNNWRLSIDPVRGSDAGLYMCQISTHPPRAILANLTVLAPVLAINGDQTHEVKDRYVKTGSSIELSCAISSIYAVQLPLQNQRTTTTTTTTPRSTTTTQSVTKTSFVNIIDLVNKSWSVETATVSSTVSVSTVKLKSTTTVRTTTPTATTPAARAAYDNVYGLVWRKQGKQITRGVTMANLSSTFVVTSATQNDSGAYSCHLPDQSSASVNIHVLIIGENQAAVHHDTWNRGLFWKPYAPLFTAVLTALILLA